MLDHATLIVTLGYFVIVAAVALVGVLGVTSLIDKCLGETTISRLCLWANVTGLAAAVGVLALMLLHGTRHEAIVFGDWVVVPDYHLSLKLVFDRLSVPFAILSLLLCGTIAAFASRYMHREPGFNRFFFLYSLFALGMVLTSLAGNIETLFAGWEFVGLSSVLLVGFYQERPAPMRNALHVWIVYRISDAALLLGAIVMHHLQGEGDFGRFLGGGTWPETHAVGVGASGFIVGLLLVIAAAGKSALVPFSGWLPRAMEGPTPSSAIFYGALSVHLGAFLLLRVSPLLDNSAGLSAVIVALGVATSLYAYIVSGVQTDIKSALCFSSLVQVGLIVAEIGLGFRYLALVHLLGNACLRTLQFIRAPTLLQDYHLLENALGEHLPASAGPLRMAPGGFRTWLYRFALERGYLDVLLKRFLVEPFVKLFQTFDALERRWTDFLTGHASRESDQVPKQAALLEDLP